MIAVLLIALIAQAVPQRDTRPATAAAAGALAGVVTSDDPGPRPLRRARVTVNGSSLQMPRTVITGDDGTFAVERLPPGRYTITAAKEGYVTMSYGTTRPSRPGMPVAVVANQSSRVAVRLPRGAVVTGTVLDVDGQPAAGVTVNVLYRRFTGGPTGDYSYGLAGTPTQSLTDDRGVYRVYGLAAGDYLVAAQPTARPDGSPATNVSFVQMMSRGTVNPRPMLLTQTFHPGTTDLSSASRVAVRAGEERSGIDVQLEYVPLATVTGTVNLPAGFGPARVTLWRIDESRPQTGTVTTADAAGRFRFPWLAPGQYRVAARSIPPAESSGTRVNNATTVQYAIADVAVNGEDLEVPLSFQPGLSIAGRIVFETDGESPSGVPVPLRLNIPSIAAAHGGWPLPPLVIDGTRFRLDGIVPGDFRPFGNLQGVRTPIGKWWLKSLVVNGRDILDAPLELLDGTEDAVATLTDRTSELSGVVTDAQSAPIGGATVVVFTTDRRGWFSNSRRIAAARASADGRYTIRNLPAGEYRVVVATDLEQNEWFDPAVLDRLLGIGLPLTISGAEKSTIDLSIR